MDDGLIESRIPYGIKICPCEFYFENAEALYKRLLLLEAADVRYNVVKRREWKQSEGL
jgi:hypothetical protein